MTLRKAPCLPQREACPHRGFALALAFTRWALQQRDPPTWQAIANRFDVSRATAYRWREAWLAVSGVCE